MKTIGNWSEIAESNSLLSAGVYLAKIVKVEDVPEKNYLKIYFDITDGQFKNYFSNAVVGDKWPYLGTFIRSYKETALTWFKAFITAIEKSNDGFVWKWNEQDLVNQKFVVVFGEEEYYDEVSQTIKVGLKPVDVRSVKALTEGKVQVPPLKKLKNENLPTQQNGSKNLPILSDEELPF